MLSEVKCQESSIIEIGNQSVEVEMKNEEMISFLTENDLYNTREQFFLIGFGTCELRN